MPRKSALKAKPVAKSVETLKSRKSAKNEDESDTDFQFVEEESDEDDQMFSDVDEDNDDDDDNEEEEHEGDSNHDGDDGEPDDERKDKSEPTLPKETMISRIKNKIRRRELYVKYLAEKRKDKKELRRKKMKEAEAMGLDAPPKQIPRTIENTREVDVTMVKEDDQEVKEDEDADEFASYFRCEREPKVIVTTSDKPHKPTIKFCKELSQTIPNCSFEWRNRSSIKKMCKSAHSHGYTDIMIINEDRREPNAMLVIHLPDGPTAHFKLSSIKYCKQIKKRAKLNDRRPEVILNNFNTRLGHSIGRMFASLFHFDPEFKGRRVVTFHNQRDYIFFRHHRYEFKSSGKVAIQEIGPRFTLKLRWLQKGTFDTKTGEYEWLLKRHEMETSRRRFFL